MPPAQKQKPEHSPQPWALSVHAKSKTFSFKFRIPGYLLPASRPRPFSLIFKSPHHFRLQLKSVTTSRHWLKSKLCRILANIRSRNPKNPFSRNPQNKQLLKSKAPSSPPISEIFFPSSSPHNDWSRRKGFRILVSVLLNFVKLLFDRITSQRLRSTSLLLLLGSAVSCWALFRTYQHLCYYDHSVPRWVWSYATSLIDLNSICQAVVSVVLSA
uniref:Uncharacterized protein n=1 Tax=Kalanchoe fedtschenkoi TaxID=63787 RepID=A0A7N0UMP2_KALFE